MGKFYILHDFTKCFKNAGQWCSCCLQSLPNAVPVVKMLFVYCSVHSKNQGTLCTYMSHYNKFV